MKSKVQENWDEAIIVALGSNLSGEYGSSAAVLECAIDGFAQRGLVVKAKSSLWRSRAWPDPAQPAYLNVVALVGTDLAPGPLLDVLHALETEHGRLRTTANAPRVLDLDLIAYGRHVSAEAAPVLPHPRASERRFVMGPLAEIAPNWRHPVSGETAASLACRANVGRDAAPL